MCLKAKVAYIRQHLNRVLDLSAHLVVWALHTLFISMLRAYKIVRRILTGTVHVYPAGGMEKARHAGKGWRTYFYKKLLAIFTPICYRLVYWNPCNFELNSAAFNVMGYTRADIANFKRKGEAIPIQRESNRRILVFDCLKVIMSDFIIAKYDKASHMSAGTKGEMTVAQFFKVPVYTWTTWHTNDLPNWIIGASTLFFKTPKDLLKFLDHHYTSRFRRCLRYIKHLFQTGNEVESGITNSGG